jgi:hypothetical protein
MKNLILVALCALALAGCQEAPQPFKSESFAFERAGAPIAIDVAQINITENYQPPLRRPNVEQDFPVAPANAIRKWVAARLKAAGNSGVLEVVIDDASVKEARLPKTEGLKGLFTDDQEARYDAKILVTLRIFTGAQGISDATGDVTITRTRSINEKATVYQREAMYQQMTAEMMADFDREANARLRQYFTRFIK